MHSATDVASQRDLFECFGCGRRVEAPEGRECDDCGGDLRNISRSRDL